MLQYKKGMILNQPLPTHMQSTHQRVVLYSVVGALTTLQDDQREQESRQARTRHFQRGLMVITAPYTSHYSAAKKLA